MGLKKSIKLTRINKSNKNMGLEINGEIWLLIREKNNYIEIEIPNDRYMSTPVKTFQIFKND